MQHCSSPREHHFPLWSVVGPLCCGDAFHEQERRNWSWLKARGWIQIKATIFIVEYYANYSDFPPFSILYFVYLRSISFPDINIMWKSSLEGRHCISYHHLQYYCKMHTLLNEWKLTKIREQLYLNWTQQAIYTQSSRFPDSCWVPH